MPRKKPDPVPEAPKPWSLTQADLDATTALEWAFGTTRCLPPEDQIPKEFWEPWNGKPNIYISIIDALFCGNDVPEGELVFNDGFTGENLMKCVEAHLRSFAPRHEHKIAGLAYMISKVTTVKGP